MKTSIDHLPEDKQAQLQAIAELFRECLAVDKLILFGSYARGEQVEDKETGYLSDYDIAVVVDNEKQAADVTLWSELEKRAREIAGRIPVTLIVHDIKFLNHEIRRGQFFFADVANEGVLLVDKRRYSLAKPKALNAAERLELAQYNFATWFDSATEFWRLSRYATVRNLTKHAAFLLHQATERYWHAAHLVFTGYKQQTHDIEKLGTMAAEQHALLVEALGDACVGLGVSWAGPVAQLTEVAADVTVIANGIDAPALWPGLPVRPVKGEVLRLRWRPGCMPVPQRVIRARVHGRQVYLVPRADGVVVGATQYEHGRDTAPAVSGVRELLDDACAVLPSLGEYELAECAAGLRPGTPDNLPIVGRLDERTLVATGHGRSGFLLAPWTAERIAAELGVVTAGGVR